MGLAASETPRWQITEANRRRETRGASTPGE
jgi:hypothetical protein